MKKKIDENCNLKYVYDRGGRQIHQYHRIDKDDDMPISVWMFF